MIRINLLGLKKEVGRGPTVSVEGAKLTVLLVIVLAAAVGVLFVDFLKISSKATELDQRLKAAQAERARLDQVKRELDQNEKRKQMLTGRIQIIEGLKANQTGPVNLLNAMASTVSLNEHLWLTSFTNDGVKVSLNGVANSVNTVADFITNLKRSGQFKNVEIRESYQEDRIKDFPTFVFSISAELAQPAPAGASGRPGVP